MRTWLMLALLAAGCTGIDLTSDATTMDVTAHEASVEVWICPGPSGLLQCNHEEAFTATVADQTVTPTVGLLSFGALVASVDTGPVAAGTLARIQRSRDAARASGTFPAPFTVTGPGAGDSVSRAAGFTLTWDPGRDGDRMIWRASVDCGSSSTFVQGGTVADDGELRIAGDPLPAVGAAGCPLAVTLRRERDGVVDGAYAGGSSITLAQQRDLGFTLTP